MFEIKVLSSDDFDKVMQSDPRYSYVDDTNLGFADRQKGVAYVRDSEIHDLNKYLINHELEELIEEHSDHEDPNGIRHKKGPKFFKQIFMPFIAPAVAALVPGIGPALSAGLGAVGSMIGGGGSKAPEPAMPSEPPVSSAFSQFSVPNVTTSTSRLPDAVTPGSNIAGSLSQGLNGGGSQNGSLTPDLMERLKGNYAGRFVF